MANNSAIEWTDTTWNPSTGCSKISSGCKYCYAATLAKRLKAMGSSRYENEFDFTIHWDKIDEPLSWRKPRKVFVNSMSDLFHEETDPEFVRQIFDVMQRTPRHRYQVLTKRPGKMRDMLKAMQQAGEYTPSSHIWLGTSVEDARVSDRIQALKDTPAGVRFLSCEPLIGDLGSLDLEGLHWVIVGGESGAHLWKERTRKRRSLAKYANGEWTAREDRMDWVRNIRDQCIESETAFFFKQWGGNTPKAAGRELDGETWDEYPNLDNLPELTAAKVV